MTIANNNIAPRRKVAWLLTGLMTLFSNITGKQARETERRERSAQILFTLYRVASETHSREQAIETLQRELERSLGINVAFFLPAILNQDRIDFIFPVGLELADADRKALNDCWDGITSPGHSVSGADWRFEPMISTAGRVGVIGIKPLGNSKLDGALKQLLHDIANQTAIILQHIELKRSMQETRVHEEREKLRAMLLSSVSHDFKTPLAGIIGALSVYRSLNQQLSQAKRDKLIETAIDEAQRLDNFITNILDMTRLESGSVKFRKEWYEVAGMIENVVRRMHMRCREHTLKIYPAPAGVEVAMDLLMTEQALQNIIDNACKYTAHGTLIELRSIVEKGKGFLLEVRDHGPGIPEEKLGAIFDKYTRLQKKDSQVAGTGLGLAIAKAIMEAQGGWVSAATHPEGGALFTLCLPEWRIAANATHREGVHQDDAHQ